MYVVCTHIFFYFLTHYALMLSHSVIGLKCFDTKVTSNVFIKIRSVNNDDLHVN